MTAMRTAVPVNGMRARLAAIGIVVIVFALLPLGLKSYGTYLCSLFCVYLMATFGLNLTIGYAGQMSLGQAAFLGIGAYIAAIGMKHGLPFFAMLPLAALACFAIGLALGFPALRVQHHYLAFATLGFNVLVFLVLRNEEAITGGTFGIRGIPRPTLFGLSLDANLVYFWFTLASTLVLMALLWWLLRSPTTRSAPKASASTSPRIRCSRSRSAPAARASPACTSPRSSASSIRRRSTSARRC
jgi:branched-chain amino acid transport system permease protein